MPLKAPAIGAAIAGCCCCCLGRDPGAAAAPADVAENSWRLFSCTFSDSVLCASTFWNSLAADASLPFRLVSTRAQWSEGAGEGAALLATPAAAPAAPGAPAEEAAATAAAAASLPPCSCSAHLSPSSEMVDASAAMSCWMTTVREAISAVGSSNMDVRLASFASFCSFCVVWWMRRPTRDARRVKSDCTGGGATLGTAARAAAVAVAPAAAAASDEHLWRVGINGAGDGRDGHEARLARVPIRMGDDRPLSRWVLSGLPPRKDGKAAPSATAGWEFIAPLFVAFEWGAAG